MLGWRLPGVGVGILSPEGVRAVDMLPDTRGTGVLACLSAFPEPAHKAERARRERRTSGSGGAVTAVL